MTFCLKNFTIHKADGTCLLPDFNLSIGAGDIVTLMGPSGCGKSTLLSAIAGHLPPVFTQHGELLLAGQNLQRLQPHQRQVGMLFQDDLLFPHLTVWENLAFALPDSVRSTARKKTALNALHHLSLIELADAFPGQISGGQRARISLTRMLLARPRLALLDEPFSKLDKSLRSQFRDWVFTQLAQEGVPTLMVTHDEDDAPPGSRIIHWPTEVPHA